MWERNYFGDLLPWLGAVMENAYTRGAVSGVGLVTAWCGLRDLIRAIVARWSDIGADSRNNDRPDAPPAPPES